VRSSPGVSRHRLLDDLKTSGPRTATELADVLGITPTAARQHLAELERDGLAKADLTPADGRGRPARRWTLTPRARQLFPDRHGDLTVQLLDAIRTTVGDEGLDAVLAVREQRQRDDYGALVGGPGRGDLDGRLAALAAARTAEGYMAEAVPADDGSWLLVEHHCPICEAAESCTGLCRSELDTFRAVLGDDVEVERAEHLLSGGERCVYRVTPVATPRRRSA
jgi:predicted ArsR family transcriptional regulator